METSSKDTSGIKIGMWLFLYSEIMLFAGLFVLYAAYLNRYQEEFVSAGKELNLVFGAANTIIVVVIILFRFVYVSFCHFDRREKSYCQVSA